MSEELDWDRIAAESDRERRLEGVLVDSFDESEQLWAFYTYWEEHAEWDYLTASLKGSSHLKLPAVFRWFTGNIGVHHVHHLNSRIPFYRLPEVLRNHPELDKVGRLTLAQSFGCIRLATKAAP